ncbi:MAG: outer membrane beta-barrel protein [Bacteroidia bacterium]
MNRLLRNSFIVVLFFQGVLSAQTFQFGLNSNYTATQFLTPKIKYSGTDSTYLLSAGYGIGGSFAIFFDHGGYYHRKIYGIRLEGIYQRANQSYKFFPGEGVIDPDVFYQYRLKTSFINVPLLFTFCPTHHQGLTVEAGPQVSFLQDVSTIAEESRNTEAVIPYTTKSFFKPAHLSFIGGVGIFVSFTEAFALTGTIRASYNLTRLNDKGVESISVTPSKLLTVGVFAQAVYKINKYDAKKNKGYKYYMRRISKSR